MSILVDIFILVRLHCNVEDEEAMMRE